MSLFKERQEKMKADLRQKIDSRDHKMAEVKSSEINCNVKTATFLKKKKILYFDIALMPLLSYGYSG